MQVIKSYGYTHISDQPGAARKPRQVACPPAISITPRESRGPRPTGALKRHVARRMLSLLKRLRGSCGNERASENNAGGTN